jgi:hypothetical protein
MDPTEMLTDKYDFTVRVCWLRLKLNCLFGWFLPVARLHEPGRRELDSRDATNLHASAEPGQGCFKYCASLAPHLHAGNQTHTSYG